MGIVLDLQAYSCRHFTEIQDFPLGKIAPKLFAKTIIYRTTM